jgi:predicted Rossmann fold flavoprotein
VLLIDHSAKVAEKIRISGGGRANFTNRDLDASAPQRHFLSSNPAFCRSALARYTPQDFTALLRQHGVAFHEKHKGQLFCDRSAEDLIDVLLAECAAGGVQRWQPCRVHGVRWGSEGYELDTDQGPVTAPELVVATGGLSIPKIGASDWGHRLAQQFGLRLVEPRPALVPLVFEEAAWQSYSRLAGLALPVRIETGAAKATARFDEDLLFTHRGLSGPAVLQISSYWQSGTPVHINLAPTEELGSALKRANRASRKLLGNELSGMVPSRLADAWLGAAPLAQRPMADVPDRALQQLADRLHRWTLMPSGTEGYRKAEVTAGGVDTQDLSSQSLQARQQPGLYFIGEVVDVTGWLGGYNFQWAWASAHASAMALGRLPG